MNLLELWPSLHKAALLGTERHGEALRLPDDAPQMLRDSLARDPEGALLGLLASATLARRAGAVPLVPTSIEMPPPSNEESREVAPMAACVRLQSFTGGDTVLLRGWLHLARERGVLAPPEVLPRLLRLGTRDKSLRADVIPVLGARGEWLAGCNAEWKWARGSSSLSETFEELQSLFENGEGTTRTGALMQMRALDPARALQVLRAAWTREIAEARAELLESLRENLSLGDEEFLEAALDDRAASVRQSAAQVLVALPQSKFVARTIKRARNYLHASRKQNVLHIEAILPSAWDEEWAREGIEKGGLRGAANAQATGQRMWWLVQMLSSVPPSTWERAWKATPDEIIEAVARDEGALLEGLRESSIRARDARWLWALLRAPLRDFTVGIAHAARLLEAIEPRERDARLAALVREVEGLSDDKAGDFVASLVLAPFHHEPWSPTLSQAVLDCMRDLARHATPHSTPSSPQRSGHAIIRYAHAIAARMHPRILAQCDHDWPDEMPSSFIGARQAMLDILAQRHEMQREFDL